MAPKGQGWSRAGMSGTGGEDWDVLGYLRLKGLVDQEDLSAPVEVATRRNISYRVFGNEHKLFVKRLRAGYHTNLIPMANEASFLKTVRPTVEGVQIPSLILFDIGEKCLVQEYLPSDGSLVNKLNAPEAVAALHFKSLALSLARLHSTRLSREAEDCAAPYRVPARDLICPASNLLNVMSPSQVALLKVAQSSDSIRHAIDRSAGGWNAQALLHGDLRLDNVLVGPSDSIALVDWECWGLGSPAWDVACPLADIIFSWITRSVEVGEDAAANHLRDIRIVSSQFWINYADCAGAVGADPLEVAVVADLICCRLFQNSFESLTGEVEMNMLSVSALQFAHNLAESRLEIMSSILGITERSAPIA